MKNLPVILLTLALASGACGKSSDSTENPPAPTAPSGAAAPASQPVKPQKPPAADDIPAPPDVAAPPADAEKAADGLAWKVLQKGTGSEKPGETDTVSVNYTGWTTDGRMFDSSVKRGAPATFALNGVIKGWTEGLGMMVVGEKRRFWIPSELAYNNRPGKPAGMLVFDVELISIKAGPKPIPPPDDYKAPPASAMSTPSGITYESVKPGTGKNHPTDAAIVKLDYTAWSADGKMMESSVSRGQPITVPIANAPPAFQELIKLMVEGEKMRAWVPEKLARRGGPPADPSKPEVKIIFELDLISIIDLSAPADVAAAPADAEKTASGLASKVLQKGTGTEHPGPTSRVKVNYTGWTTDGKEFDSSISRGIPAEFALNQVIPGWTEGVQLMVVGEKRRFWIPAKMAYEGKEGPQGQLCFDVELLDVKK